VSGGRKSNKSQESGARIQDSQARGHQWTLSEVTGHKSELRDQGSKIRSQNSKFICQMVRTVRAQESEVRTKGSGIRWSESSGQNQQSGKKNFLFSFYNCMIDVSFILS
jgi:hypothetical protein